MKKGTLLFWTLAILVVGISSILMAGAVERGLIQPVLRVFWLLKGYYGSVPQAFLWILTMVMLIIIAIRSLSAESIHLRGRQKAAERPLGEVGQLAFWIARSPLGFYPRWYLARTLSDLALDVLRGRGVNAERGGKLQGPNWNPPGQAQGYLETAMRTTPASFGRQLEISQVSEDPRAESIVDYLESYVESTNDH